MIGFYYIALVSIFANVLPANGNVWTVDCSTVATQRKDPIVFPHENQAGLKFSIFKMKSTVYNEVFFFK